jgi:hypothetical protein
MAWPSSSPCLNSVQLRRELLDEIASREAFRAALAPMPFPASLSAGPPSEADVLPGTALCVALRIQDLRTRIFRGIELKDHPLRIWNARIRNCVQKLDFFVRESQIYRTDVILQLLPAVLEIGRGCATLMRPSIVPTECRPSGVKLIYLDLGGDSSRTTFTKKDRVLLGQEGGYSDADGRAWIVRMSVRPRSCVSWRVHDE